MPARIVVLGGGVGGTLVANLLDRSLGRDARVTVVDATGMHAYQPGFLYVALGQANGRWLTRDITDPDSYTGITSWDSLETLQAYEAGVSREIIAAVQPFMASEWKVTYYEDRYLWLPMSDYSGA